MKSSKNPLQTSEGIIVPNVLGLEMKMENHRRDLLETEEKVNNHKNILIIWFKINLFFEINIFFSLLSLIKIRNWWRFFARG